MRLLTKLTLMAGLLLTTRIANAQTCTCPGTVAPMGAYVGYPGQPASDAYPGFDAQWDGLASTMQRAPTLYLLYIDQRFAPNDRTNGWPQYSSWLSGALAADSRTKTVTPILGVPFGYNTSDGSKVNLFSQIAAGNYDLQIKGMLAAWKSNGYTTMYLRPAWEFNLPNNYAVTAANAPAFISAWKQFYTVVHSYASSQGMNVNIVWNPNVGFDQNDRSVTVEQTFPGASYVDVIAIDTYGAFVYPGNDPTATSTDPRQYLLTTMISMGKTYGKPVAVAEIGGIDLTFVTKFVQIMSNAHVSIAFIGLWDISDSFGALSWSNPSDNQGGIASTWVSGLGINGTIRNY